MKRPLANVRADTSIPGAEEIALIEHALHRLLRAMREHELRQPRPASFRLVCFEDIVGQSPVQSLLDEPVPDALRLGIRKLGKRLYDLGGLDLMTTVLDRVARKDPSWRMKRENILDNAWSVIGSDEGGWWVA